MLSKFVWKCANKLLRNQNKFAFIVEGEDQKECEITLMSSGWTKTVKVYHYMGDSDIWGVILDALPISRNVKYELKRKAQGLKKVTFWIPEESEPEVQLLCNGMCDNPNLQVAMLRDKDSGKYVSVNKL